MESPERLVVTFTHRPETVLRDFADQILWQGLVVGNLKGALGRLVIFQFLAKGLHRRRGGREAAVRLVRGEGEQEPRLHEERGAPLDRLLGLRRDALEDRIQPAQMRLPRAWSRLDILGDCRQTLVCHFFCFNYGRTPARELLREKHPPFRKKCGSTRENRAFIRDFCPSVRENRALDHEKRPPMRKIRQPTREKCPFEGENHGTTRLKGAVASHIIREVSAIQVLIINQATNDLVGKIYQEGSPQRCSQWIGEAP